VTLRLPREWRVPAAFALLCIGALLYDAAHAWFWQRSHDTAPVAALLVLLLVGLLLRRSRFAWWVFFSFGAVGLVTWLIRIAGHHVGSAWILGLAFGVAQFALLASAPMRRFVRFRGRLAPRSN
jgi:hypothetical protein